MSKFVNPSASVCLAISFLIGVDCIALNAEETKGSAPAAKQTAVVPKQTPVIPKQTAAAVAATNENVTSDEHNEKLALIKQLLETSRTLRNAQIGFKTMIEQQMRGYHVAINNHIDRNPNLNAQQKQDAKRVELAGFNKRAARMRELFAQKFDLNQVVAQTYVKLYDKYYTTAEIKDMLAFYKSPTGQKMLDNMPHVAKEMTADMDEVIMPKLQEVDAIMTEEEKAGKFRQ